MRQIKFRGRDLSGKYRFGFYAESGDVPYIIENCTWHEVEPNSVAQLVGHDSNGNEVYEGDTVVLNSDDYPLEYTAHLSGYATGDRGIYISAGQFDRVTLKEAQS